MTVWDLRQWIESAIPWWVPVALGAVAIMLALGLLVRHR